MGVAVQWRERCRAQQRCVPWCVVEAMRQPGAAPPLSFGGCRNWVILRCGLCSDERMGVGLSPWKRDRYRATHERMGVDMAWEFSHSEEGYATVRIRIGRLGIRVLRVIFAEIYASGCVVDEGEAFEASDGVRADFDERDYALALESAKLKDKEELVRFVIAFTFWQSTCDNGGFNAHVCPYGCHTVSFG